MIEVGLITARFLHLAAVMALFGLALFPVYSADAPPARVIRLQRTSIFWAALLGIVSALAWGWFAIAGMTGVMMAAADSQNLLTVLRETSFGQFWVARLALGGVLLALMIGRSSEHYLDWTTVLLAGLLLASLALVGHTQTSDGALWVGHVSADGAHLLAAGAWLGGLLALGYVLMLARRFPSAENTTHAVAALVRFSGMGYAAVAVLIGSGLVNAWVLTGPPTRLLTTPYGQLLLVKVCLLAGMLALAAHNRFRLVPALQRSKERCLPVESLFQALRRNVIGEAIVLIVASLGTLPPATTASQ